ncbi:MAG: CPBP family intramembrane glutamic endopeptidase, partial [Myxococcota bacterium]
EILAIHCIISFFAMLAIGMPVALTLAVFAVVPALCEELLFRGAILGMMARTAPAARVVVNAAMFGAIHLSIHRFGPTAALGVLAAVAVIRSGSLAPAIVIHALHAAIVLGFADRPAITDAPGWGLGIAAAVAVAAVGLTGWGRPEPLPTASTASRSPRR